MKKPGLSTRLFGAQMAIALVNLPVTVLLARTLGPDGLGEYQFLNRTTLLVIGLTVFGFPHALAWAAGFAKIAEDRRRLVARAYAVSTGGAIALIGIMAVLLFADIVPLGWPAYLFTMYAALNVYSANQINLLRGWLAVRETLYTRLSQATLWAVGVSLLFLRDALSVETAVASLLVAQTVALLVGAFCVRSCVSQQRSEPPTETAEALPGWRSLNWYAARVFPSVTIREWSTHADQVLIGAVLGATALGNYTVGASLSVALGMATTPLTNTIQPVLQKTVDRDGRLQQSQRFYAATIFMFLVPGFVAFLLAPWAVPVVFGSRFTDSVDIFQILCVGALFAALTACGHGCLLALNRPGVSSISLGAGFLTSVIVWLVSLAMNFGPEGIAVGVVIGSFVSASLMYGNVCRALRVSIASNSRGVAVAMMNFSKRFSGTGLNTSDSGGSK